MRKILLQDGYYKLLRVSAALLSVKFNGEYTIAEWIKAEDVLAYTRRKILNELGD